MAEIEWLRVCSPSCMYCHMLGRPFAKKALDEMIVHNSSAKIMCQYTLSWRIDCIIHVNKQEHETLFMAKLVWDTQKLLC